MPPLNVRLTFTVTLDDPGTGIFAAELGTHQDTGPDVLKVIRAADLGEVYSFKTTFAPSDTPGRFRCVVGGALVEVGPPNMPEADWREISETLKASNSALGLFVPDGESRVTYKIPGSLLMDTPRFAVKGADLPTLEGVQLNQDSLIQKWYAHTNFNHTVCLAAAALTKLTTRDKVFGFQEATVKEVADLVYWNSDGSKAHGQHRQDILKAFWSLLDKQVPLVIVDWQEVGTKRTPRWIKKLKIRFQPILQSFAPIFTENKTGKKIRSADDAHGPLVEQLKMLAVELDRYTLTGFEWRWNTSIAEDFICPAVALYGKKNQVIKTGDEGKPRLKINGEIHVEGIHYHNVAEEYFQVMKSLRAGKSKYAQRLLDFIISELTHITGRDGEKGLVFITIDSSKIITLLGLSTDYKDHPKHVLEGHIAPAIVALIKEKVILPGSSLVPEIAGQYRWQVAEKWTTVAKVVKKGETIALLQTEAAKAILPGETLSPSGLEIRFARVAAGFTLREFALAMSGPSFKTWSLVELGQRSKSAGRIPEEVWGRVREFVSKYGSKET